MNRKPKIFVCCDASWEAGGFSASERNTPLGHEE